jgi:hypothetical protein
VHRISLHKKKTDSLLRKHPWVFSGAIYSDTSSIEDGETVTVVDHHDRFLAIGHFQHATISVRILSFKETNIVGKIKLDKSEALFFSIPFDPSWSAKVDGKIVKLYRANLGLMALPLTAGEHSIELSFTPPFWNLSLMLSGLGFTFFVVLLLILF